MIKNYLKIAFRNLIRHKAYSIINIAGLSVGLACCLVIALFIINELNYDDFQQNKKNIFRVIRVTNDGKVTREIGVTSYPFGDALKNDYPGEVKDAIYVMPNEGLVTYDDKSFREKRFFLAGNNFFRVFSFPLVSGNSSTVLTNPNDVVISESMSKKYFGQDDPVGKTITVDKAYSFIVTGVFKDVPDNSHIKFDFVASIDIMKSSPSFNYWWNNSGITYLVLPSASVKKTLEPKLSYFMEKYFGSHMKTTGILWNLKLEPLKDIYFNNATQFDPVAHGDISTVYIFSGIAVFILLIACINFMNLATAKSAGRAKEVGLRKVIGAARKDLIFQFIGEAIFLSFLSVLFALLFVEIMLPYFNNLTELNLHIPYNTITLPLVLSIVVLVVGTISGSYPAIFLSSLKPAAVLKGKMGKRGRNIQLRKLLVVFQFSLSVLLIIATLIINQQMNFLSDKKLGFDKEQVVFFNLDNDDVVKNEKTLKDELLRNYDVLSVSAMSGQPGGFHDNYAYIAEGQTNYVRMRSVFADFDYIKTFGIKLKAGRDFSKEYSTDNKGMILNESAVKNFGWTNEEALGKRILINLLDSTYQTVIGVVEDYHFTSLKQRIEPLAIASMPRFRVMAVKIRPGNITEAVKKIEAAYHEASPGYPFEFQFLDQSFNSLYKSEEKQEDVFSIFALLAILISCLGLFGLTSFSAEQRTKEIGIRKVLGSTVPGIIYLLLKDYFKLIIAANMVAWPLAYYISQKWLNDFAYRIDITLMPFIISSVVAIFIAFFTVVYHAYKAAQSNPVKSLKYE